MALISARRASAVVAAAAAITLGLAGTASAHHCYKVNWNEVAHAKQATNGSPWTPLSDVFEMFVVPDVYPECAGWGDRAAQLYMEDQDLSLEPLIHSKATIGTGEKPHPQGKKNPVIDYLGAHEDLLNEVVYQVGVECGAFPGEEG